MTKIINTIFCVLTVLININQIAIAQEVAIPDANLITAVQKQLDLPQDTTITQQIMQELTKLTAQRAQISDLTGLEYATNIKHLNLNGNQISQISAILGLTNLQTLSLRSNKITDINPIANLTKLQTIWLGSNNITDMTPIKGLTQLKILFIESNQISDISAIKDLTTIEQLSLFDNDISDLNALARLTQLKVLSLGVNRISDIGPLAGLGNLEELYLNENQISDLMPLEELTALKGLWIGDNQISVLPTLSKLTQLTDLSLESNNIRVISPLTELTQLQTLVLASNQIANIKPLQELKNLEGVDISDNPISNISHIQELINLGVDVDFDTTVPHESKVAQTRVLFNEIRNDTDDKNDWVELRNISMVDISLNEWEISILDRQNNTDRQDIDIVEFPDYTLPAGGVLLITNTDPSKTALLRGQNIRTPDIYRGAQHDYMVADELILPDTQYLLILRSDRNSNGTLEAIEDVAGTYFHDKLTGDQPLTQGTAWQRSESPKVGYNVEAWDESGYQAGIGYQNTAPKSTSPGTPGYHNDSLVTNTSRGQIYVSEVMFTNKIGNQTVSQWIELYNRSQTKAVNLTGWRITIESRHGNQNRRAVFTFKNLNVLPNQTVLIVTATASKSDNLPDRRIYNIHSQHLTDLIETFPDLRLLSPDGFSLQISTPNGVVVDTVGNLDGDSQTQDTPAWNLPSGTTENGARSSILRQYHHETRMPFIGTEKSNWRNATDVKLGKTTYYGNLTDVGNPAYTLGGILPVTLSRFQAEQTKTGVIIKWTTESEVDNAGFYIYRSETRDGAFKVVNTTMIQGVGTTGERNEYTWTDTTAKTNTVYYYRIEDVSHAGEREQLATVRLRGLISASGKLTIRWADMKK